MEWKFAPQWSVKAEYLYVDLGHSDTTSINSLTPVGTTITHEHHLTENIGRVGVNYHF